MNDDDNELYSDWLITNKLRADSHIHGTTTIHGAMTMHDKITIRVDDSTNVDISGKIYTGAELSIMLECLEELTKEKYPEKFI